MTTISSPNKLSALMRDLASGLGQQMFFWGRDASYQAENLLVRNGFTKRASSGLQGTSCYSLPWRDGVIELHGSHAGWFGNGGGFLFVRPLGRCVRWLEETSPVPGTWPCECYDPTPDAKMHALAVPFLDWWLEHERALARFAGVRYRQVCFRQFKKLPKTRAWLAPQQAVRWITALRDEPQTLLRAKRFDAPFSS
jgi:hypothetical protein